MRKKLSQYTDIYNDCFQISKKLYEILAVKHSSTKLNNVHESTIKINIIEIHLTFNHKEDRYIEEK